MPKREACIGCISRETCIVLRSHYGYWECGNWYPERSKKLLIKEEQKR